jgi:glutamine synthetase
MGLKDIAYKFGITPCFMAKPAAHLPGNGAHMHQNLSDSSGKNLFYDESAEDKMSTLFKHYLAGQLHCLPCIYLYSFSTSA